MTTPNQDATVETEIDGHKFSITKLPGTKALRMSYRLARVVGPAGLGAVDDMSAAAELLFKQMPENDFMQMQKDLLATCLIDERPLNPDLDFQGSTVLFFKVIGFALEANFADFKASFMRAVESQLGKQILAFVKRAAEEKMNPNTSANSGPATDSLPRGGQPGTTSTPS